ncbi:cupin domain-containing protein [Asticcacaulis sp. 201]|uniref:cupin domain-containing protein n=1 Tax=Asticcacaulis sp. 201 TaxID=3028787 RepID=UPI002916DE3D|nr:cupin domain-containing protein [Asticcacaulis sp. 201]MDV6331150.1 cupin domain-containing protein [Asticcacaulis sp. 201]
MSEPDDFLAVRYALGVADLIEVTTAELRLDGDPDFASKVAFYDEIFTRLDMTLLPMAPSSSVWARIEQSITDIETAPETDTVRGSNMAWEPFIPGVERKILFVDKATATSGVLYKVAAGASVDNHGHALIEECLVIEGEIDIAGVIIRPGDLHVALPGSRHGPLFSRHGAVVYIRGDLQIQA